MVRQADEKMVARLENSPTIPKDQYSAASWNAQNLIVEKGVSSIVDSPDDWQKDRQHYLQGHNLISARKKSLDHSLEDWGVECEEAWAAIMF